MSVRNVDSFLWCSASMLMICKLVSRSKTYGSIRILPHRHGYSEFPQDVLTNSHVIFDDD